MDWNNDGLHDLLVGDGQGEVWVYLNTHTNTEPVLSGAHAVMAGNAPLDAGERAAPVVFDFNGDGKKDLLVGSMDGRISIYINEGTDADPHFKTRNFLRTGGKDIYISSRSAPRVYDWNGDGLQDLLVGEMEGHVYLLINKGTDTEPAFAGAEKLYLRNGDVLRYPDPSGNARSRLSVTDWDNDGRPDILLGGRDGNIILYRAAPGPSASPIVLLNKVWNRLRESALKLRRYARELKEDLKNR